MIDLETALAALNQKAAQNGKDWLRLSDIQAVLQAQPPVAGGAVNGLDAQGWYDAARRYHAGLLSILKTEGASIDIAWARLQAARYLDRQPAGTLVWPISGAENLLQLVVPGSAVVATRLRPMPSDDIAVLIPGESVTLPLENPRG